MSHINEHGNTVTRYSDAESDRYAYDRELTQDTGWHQFDTDQDAWYFGVWVNPTQRKIVTYAEGDGSIVECPTVESYNDEIRHMLDFYTIAPAFTSLDTDKGTCTRHYQNTQSYYASKA